MSHPALRFQHESTRLGLVGTDRANHDLVANPVAPRETAGRALTYHGGPTLQTPRLFLVFVNDFWDDWTKADAFARDLMEGGYLKPLAELGYGSGPGTFGGSSQIRRALPNPLRDSDIKAILLDALQSGEVPPADENTLHSLILPQGVTTLFDGDSRGSCETWCGYHSHLQTPDGQAVAYSVEPATECGPCRGAQTPFEAFCMVLAHEVAEACTDPLASGWWDESDGAENADIVAWVPLPYGPWTVQGYYCNETGNTMGAYVPPDQRGNEPPVSPAATCPDRVTTYIAEKAQKYARSRVTAKTLLKEMQREIAGVLSDG